MKTERRHELQHNDLADRLAIGIEKLQPYGRVILGIIVLLAVAIFAGGYMARSSAKKDTLAWDDYFRGFDRVDTEKLSETATKYPSTAAGEWSNLVAADILLNQGINQLFTDKAAGRSKLQEAADRYQSVLGNVDQPLVKQRALYGLARAHESRGELKLAAENYADLLKKYPTGPFASIAREREKDINRDDTKKFYDWFAQYEPPRSTKGLPGKPGERPSDFLDELPDGPDLSLPSSIDVPSVRDKSLINDKLPLPAEDPAATDDPLGDDPASDKPAPGEPSTGEPSTDPAPGDAKKPADKPSDAPASEPESK